MKVTIITTANRIRHFETKDESVISEILNSLKRTGQLFLNKTLIIASDKETEIFSPSSITRIEISTNREIRDYIPLSTESRLIKIPKDIEAPPSKQNQTYAEGRIDFFFEGGDTIPLLFMGNRPNLPTQQIMNINQLFDQQYIAYELPDGGFGLLNPSNLTRLIIASDLEHLPSNAWKLNPSNG